MGAQQTAGGQKDESEERGVGGEEDTERETEVN